MVTRGRGKSEEGGHKVETCNYERSEYLYSRRMTVNTAG